MAGIQFICTGVGLRSPIVSTCFTNHSDKPREPKEGVISSSMIKERVCIKRVISQNQSNSLAHELQKVKLLCRYSILQHQEINNMLPKLFLFVSCLILSTYGARHAVPMKTYKLDLNDPPETRWNHIMEHYLSSLPLIIDYFDSMVSSWIELDISLYIDLIV